MIAESVFTYTIGELNDKAFLIARRVARIGTMDGVTCAMRLAIDDECCISRTKMHVCVTPKHGPRANAVAESLLLPNDPFVLRHASSAIAYSVVARFHVRGYIPFNGASTDVQNNSTEGLQ